MRKLLYIFILLVFTLPLTGQNRVVKYYLPRIQTDSIKVVTSFILQGDTFRLTSPINGQILQRDSGIWKNMNNAASVFDSITWNPSTGNLSVWKSGTPFNYANLDGRYALNDTTLGDMTRAEYDTANVSEQLVGINASQILTNKTLIQPVIASFINAQHDHSTAAQGDTINSDYIKEGNVNLFSKWINTGSNIYYNTGNVGIGTVPTALLDVAGTTKTQILNISNSFIFDGLTLTDIQTGESDNTLLVTKGYVDGLYADSVGFSNEEAQDALGTILDDGTVGDIVFAYNDGTPLISGEVENDSHTHNGTTISGLSVADFTSANISAWTNDANYITISQAVGGDLTGTINNAQVTNDSHDHTVATLPNLVSSVDGVVNDGGNIDLIASGSVTITPNDAANTITIAATDAQNLSSTKGGNTVAVNISGGTGTSFSVADADSSVTNEIQVLSISNDTITLSKSGGSVKLPSGADNWGTQYVKLNSDSLIRGRGTTGSPLRIDTTKIATQYDITGFLSAEVDGSITNESQTFGIGHMSWPYIYVSAAGGAGGGVVFLKGKGINTITNSGDSILVTGTEVDGSITNEIQNLSKSKAGNSVTLNISGGTGTTFSVADNDSSATNEIQNLTYTSGTRSLDISSGTGVTLPMFSTTAVTPGLAPGSNSGGSSVFLDGSGNWSVPSGAGNVSKVGTPVNDRVAVWTGDGTIEGDADLTFNGTKLTTTQLHISSPTAGTADYDKFLVLDLSGTEVKYRTGAEILSDIGAQASFTSGNLTESVTGLQFDNTQQVIGGAATLSLTSGYVIPTTTEQTNWGTAYTHSTSDADLSSTNEIQNLSKSKAGNYVTLSISSGTGTGFSVADGDSSSTNEIELPSQSGNSGKFLSTNGTSPSWTTALTAEVDGSITNEIQNISISNDTIYLSKSGGSVKLPTGADNWGTQYVKLNSDSLIRGKGTTGSPLRIDTSKIATQHDLTSLSNNSGWTDSGTSVSLATSSDFVGIGTAGISPNKLTVNSSASTSYGIVINQSGSTSAALVAYNTSNTGIGQSIVGITSGSTSRAIDGYSNSTSGENFSIRGQNASSDGYAGYFYNTASTGNAYAIYASTLSSSGYAGYFSGRVFATGNIGTGQTYPIGFNSSGYGYLSRITAPSTPTAGTGYFYMEGTSGSEKLYFKNNSGAYDLTASTTNSWTDAGAELYPAGSERLTINPNQSNYYAGTFMNNSTGYGLRIYAGSSTYDALLVSDYEYTQRFKVTGAGKVYANSLTNASKSYCLYYDTSTKEISYSTLPSGGGTVTSVGLSLPAQFTVSGSPVTSSGTLTASWASAGANLFFAGPNGGSGTPYFRAIVDNDVPNTITASNYLPLAGGTMTGKITGLTPGTYAPVRLPHGSTPSSLENGDLWTTTSGLYARINGSTVGPFDVSSTNEIELPSQTGNSGKYLTTNGTSPSWATVSASPAGSGSEIQYRNSGSFGAITGSSVSSNNVSFTGTVTASNFILSSDQRLKENMKPVSSLEWIDDIEIMTFNMRGDNNKRYGVIAQQVLKVNPELVRRDKDGIYSVAYTDYLIAKVARQDEKIRSLEERIEKLEKLIK